MKIVKFMTSGMGRGARIVLGLVILSVGLLVVQGTPGLIMAVVALVPLAGGVFDYCLVGAALGYPFWGAEARKKLAGQ
jgi:hypothetical protein